jgi:outer membrane protein assembly factor BamB
MLRPILLATLITLAFNTGSFAASGDWPQWRGPKRDGISTETGLLKEWPTEGPPLVWKATGLGSGYSTPSVAGGRIYGAGYRDEDEVAWCLDARDGKELWSVTTGKAARNIGYPEGPRSTPTVEDGLVYTLGAGGNLVCLDSTSGKERWHKEYKQDFGGRMMSGWGFSESPLVDGDKLLCTPGGMKGTLVALNKKTGELIWQAKDWTDRSAYASIITAEIGGAKQYIQLTDASVAGVAPEDGRLLWRAPRRGSTAVIPTPIFHDNCVFVTSGYRIGCNLFKITSEGKEFKAEEVYANHDMENHHGGVVLIGDHLYGHSDSRGWVCMEFKTGKVVWAKGGVGKGSVTYADGHLYTRSEGGKGNIALVEASPEGYKETGRFAQPDRSSKNSWPHPVIAGGRLYLRDQEVLLCYDVKQK